MPARGVDIAAAFTPQRYARAATLQDGQKAFDLSGSGRPVCGHAGIAGNKIHLGPELTRDPQLAHLGHFVALSHPGGGTTTVEGSRIRLSATPARVEGSAPTFGRDNQRILETILGYDEDRIAQLVMSGALG